MKKLYRTLTVISPLFLILSLNSPAASFTGTSDENAEQLITASVTEGEEMEQQEEYGNEEPGADSQYYEEGGEAVYPEEGEPGEEIIYEQTDGEGGQGENHEPGTGNHE